jgi:hypothetical protein
MSAAVSFDDKPLNVTCTCIVWAISSMVTKAKPVAVDELGGDSAGPLIRPT